MADERTVDEQLVAVLNEVLDAVYQPKQAAWSATASPVRDDLRELVTFLINQSGRLILAEEHIDGRLPDVRSPSSHQRRNLVAEAGGDQRQGGIAADRPARRRRPRRAGAASSHPRRRRDGDAV